jgi:hypothetical protein
MAAGTETALVTRAKTLAATIDFPALIKQNSTTTSSEEFHV